MFEKLRNYRNISKIRKTAISENKNFGKKCPTQGLTAGTLEMILTNTLDASKNDAHFKSGQNRLENNHLASLI